MIMISPTMIANEDQENDAEFTLNASVVGTSVV